VSTTDFRAASKPKMNNKKKYTLFAVGGIGGLGLVLWYRKHSASSSSSTDTSGTDTSTADSGIDPSTGIPYADEYGGDTGAYGVTPGAEGTYDPLTGQYIPGYGTTGQVTTIATNAEWAQAAITTLTGEGYDPATVTTAIGLFLAGQALTQNQYDIVTAAIGVEGNPPSSVTPPHLAGGGGAGQTNPVSPAPPHQPVGPGSGVSGGKVTVPNVIGSSGLTARLAIAARGLKSVQSPKTTQRGKSTTVTSQSPKAGSKVKLGSTVTINVKVK
jgi:PASTA domain